MKWEITVGADVRCYQDFTVDGETLEEARLAAVEAANSPANYRKWEPEEVQGEISVLVRSNDEQDEFDEEWWDEPAPEGAPRYNDLLEFAQLVARLTTPEEEFADAKASQGDGPVEIDGMEYEDESEYVGDISDDRLLEELSALKSIIMRARDVLAAKNEGGGDKPDAAAVPDAPRMTHAPANVALIQVIKDLLGALDSTTDQIEQMQGMFDDGDGTIQEALDDAEKAGQAARAAILPYTQANEKGATA